MARPSVQTYTDLASHILAFPGTAPRLGAGDGPGGAGKSAFAARLSAALAGCPVVHTDDFALWDDPIDWEERLQRQVVDPLAVGRAACYQRYDWDLRVLAEWHRVPLAPAIIIEGVSSARRAIAPRLALAVWLHTPRTLRLERGLMRDSAEALPRWESWMAEEDAHFLADRTIDRCNVLVEGAPTIAHDPEHEFVRLATCAYV